MTSDDVAQVVRLAAEQVEPRTRAQLTPHFVAPRREVHPYGSEGSVQSAELWVVMELQDFRVGVVYSTEGYATEIDARWGLVRLDQIGFGSSGNWYRTLGELVDDCGYFRA